MKRVHVRVLGRVQGVFFRASTQEQANKLCLSGWVQNMPDGSVEAEIQGDEMELKKMLNWLQTGPPLSKVNDVQIKPIDSIGSEAGFEVT